MSVGTHDRQETMRLYALHQVPFILEYAHTPTSVFFFSQAPAPNYYLAFDLSVKALMSLI